MTSLRFDKTALETARERIAALFDAYSDATGFPITFVSELAAGDRAFASRYKRKGMSFATYDMVAGRLSALWPEDAQWPESVPRPKPDEVPAAALAMLAERARKDEAGANAVKATWPKGAPWPADIPRPDHMNREVNHG